MGKKNGKVGRIWGPCLGQELTFCKIAGFFGHFCIFDIPATLSNLGRIKFQPWDHYGVGQAAAFFQPPKFSSC